MTGKTQGALIKSVQWWSGGSHTNRLEKWTDTHFRFPLSDTRDKIPITSIIHIGSIMKERSIKTQTSIILRESITRERSIITQASIIRIESIIEEKSIITGKASYR